MLVRVLAVGDVVSEPGLRHLEKHLRSLQKCEGISFTVVNGENAASVGLTPEQAWRIYDAGADVVTLGNHTFGKMQIADFLDDTPWLLRPANFTGRAPGRGCGVYDLGGVRIRVMNLIGRCDLSWGADNPFTTADRLLAEEQAELTVVDFHAQATSEKLAMAYYLDGRVSALIQEAAEKGVWLAALCAAPILLGRWGLLDGREATSYPTRHAAPPLISA